MSDLAALARRLEQFADARDWAQFHTPKNLAMALAGEVGELVAEFQWLTPEQAPTVVQRARHLATTSRHRCRVAGSRTSLRDPLGPQIRLSAVSGQRKQLRPDRSPRRNREDRVATFRDRGVNLRQIGDQECCSLVCMSRRSRVTTTLGHVAAVMRRTWSTSCQP